MLFYLEEFGVSIPVRSRVHRVLLIPANVSVQGAAAKDSATPETRTTAAPLQPMVRRILRQER
ncbi:hypothetical protein [Rosistilla carotiformis]|uniref:hypothetical protein n=1 Tax=Rosistilla carotiformis TaxID=2528017 RepID=UPI0011A3C0C3|nr:hypothetical protein [Rosistilla carotiformis]